MAIIDERIKLNGNCKPIEYKEDNGCWVCVSHALHNTGYVKIWRGHTKERFAHRYLYEQYYGLIPNGMIIRHKCDNKLCVNPKHLEVGTQSDNNEDASKRNRSRRKLTDADVLTIRESKESIHSLSRKYNISRATVQRIKKGELYRWLSR